MDVRLTENAYAGYVRGEADARQEGDAAAVMASLQAKLQDCANRGAMHEVQWQGGQALYVLDAYWRFERRASGVVLTECIAVFRALKVPRWNRVERPTRRQA